MSPALRIGATATALVLCLTITDAEAITRGHGAGAISRHVVKLVGRNLLCSGTVVGRQEVLTSAHCLDGSDPYYVIAGGRIRVASHSNLGGAALLRLERPLPRGYVPIATGGGAGGGTYTIAGHGSATETRRPQSAGLRAATLVRDATGALVDPNRRGEIGASACLGDSGGPVAVFDGSRYMLVGIIERASHPSPHRGCGHLTHYVPVGGMGFGHASYAEPFAAPAQPQHRVRGKKKRRLHGRRR